MLGVREALAEADDVSVAPADATVAVVEVDAEAVEEAGAEMLGVDDGDGDVVGASVAVRVSVGGALRDAEEVAEEDEATVPVNEGEAVVLALKEDEVLAEVDDDALCGAVRDAVARASAERVAV